MNPYEILEIPHDASAAAIKKAYRVAAKKHHPDAGGDPEVFQQIAIAYSVLTDEEKRAHYDATGEIDQKSEMNTLSSVVGMISGLIDQILAQYAGNGEKIDLVSSLGRAAEATLQSAMRDESRLRAQLRDLEWFRKRVKRNDDEPNIFIDIIDKKIEGFNAHLRDARHAVTVARRCSEEMQLYSSPVDLVRTMQGFMYATRPSPTSGMYFTNVTSS